MPRTGVGRNVWKKYRSVVTRPPGETVNDEAGRGEGAGGPVSVVPASPANLKVTHAEDIPVANALLRARHGSPPTAGPVRTGIGYDAHRFASGRRLVLGGVAPIPWTIADETDLDTATPLPRTEWKVAVARALVRRAATAVGGP